MLEATPVRAFSDNYIWLIHGARQRMRVAAVDPGDAKPVIAALERGLENHRLRNKVTTAVFCLQMPETHSQPREDCKARNGEHAVIPYLGPEISFFMQAKLKPEADESQALLRPDKKSRRPTAAQRRPPYFSSVTATLEQLIRRILWSVSGSKVKGSKSDGL